MKYSLRSLCVLMLLVPFISVAEDCSTISSKEEVLETKTLSTDVPSHLKGAKIIVRLADGRESEVPAEKFKVVPRKQQLLVTKVQNSSETVCAASKNRISGLLGRGAKEGLNRTNSTGQVDVESRTGTVGGVQYQRMLNDKLSIGAQAQSNKTGSVILGIDF